MNTAISANFLLWALLMISCPDPGWTTQAEEMASLEVKMTNIMDRMTRMEAEMVAKDEMVEVRDQRIAVLEAAMNTKDQRIAVLENFVELQEKTMRGMVDQARNPPYVYQCAWQDGPWNTSNRRDIQHSHWSSSYITSLSLVESCRVLKYFQGIATLALL